jgi:hypothetical protein
MSLGDYPLGAVIETTFTTRFTGTPTTLVGGAVAVYRDADTAQSTTGITLTADFDDTTGLNHLRINTNADTAFYLASSQFSIVLTAGTVGGDPVAGTVVEAFTITSQVTAIPLPGRINVLDLITTAFALLNVFLPGESIPASDGTLAVTLLTGILDAWNAHRPSVWTTTVTDYTLTPHLTPHTIGPTGTFVVSSRPVSIDRLTLTASGAPLTVRDVWWWQAQPSPDLTGLTPTDCYYDPAVPNGALYFWPVPTTAAVVALETRVLLPTISLASSLDLPPGYRQALIYTLAEVLSVPYGRPVSPQVEKTARQARARIQANNVPIPPLFPEDGGLFDYRSRSFH